MGPSAPVAACRQAVRAALRDLVGGENPLVLVAVSGGADSLALLTAACFAGPRMGVRVGGVTVDHGLQPGSADRARAVAAYASRLGADPVSVWHVVVDGGGGPEAAARRSRYRALSAAASAARADAVLLAHTLDDQAETVLLGLARGSGARSLAGMAGVAGIYRRPMLALPRGVLAAAARQAAAEPGGLSPWDDPHNADPAFRRPRVRHRVLPVMESEIGPGVAAALARTADLLRDDADALDEWAARAAAELLDGAGVGGARPASAGSQAEGMRSGPPGPGTARGTSVEVDAIGLSGLPTAVRTRVLRRAALAAGAAASDLSAAHVRAMDSLVTGDTAGLSIDLPSGVQARRTGGRLELTRAPDVR